MNNRYKTKGVRVLALFISFIMLSSFAAAFVITSPVELAQTKLNLFPNENKQIFFYAQLGEGEGNTVNIELIKGSEVLTLVGPTTVNVPTNTLTQIFFEVNVPSNAKVGDSYEGEIVFRSAGEGSGTVGIGTSVKKVFSINVVEEPKEEGEKSNALIFILLIIAIIILALIIYYIVRRKK